MPKVLTDIHTHSSFSPDGHSALEEMIETACKNGLTYFGVSEHFEFEATGERGYYWANEREYFPAARALQKKYEGKIHLLVGAEVGYRKNEKALASAQNILAEYKPDFVVNSVHSVEEMVGDDDKDKIPSYKKYLSTIEESLDAPYSYDIVGHLGFIARYVDFEDRSFPYEQFREEWDRIFAKIIEKGKILEVNSKLSPARFEGDKYLFYIPEKSVLKGYFNAGGRKISYASDAHGASQIARNREMVVEMLKEIGFEYLTVPCQGEHIQIEL